MTEPEAAPVGPSSLDQVEAEYRRVIEQLGRAENDYLELLEQADKERAASLAEVVTAHDTAANVMAEAAALLDRAEHEAHRVREAAEVEAAARRAEAERDVAEVSAMRAQAERELAEVSAQRERVDRLRAAAAEALAAAEAQLANAQARRDEIERTEAEAARIHAEALDALDAVNRMDADREVLRQTLGAVPRPTGEALPHAVARTTPTDAPVHIPPRLLVVALGIVVLCSLGAYIVASLGDKVYGGRVEILVDVPSTSSTAERQLATQRVLIESQIVTGTVAADEGVSIEEIERSIHVEVVGASEVLRLTIGASDPELALDRAQAVADRYVELVEDVASDGTAPGLTDGTGPTSASLLAPARVLDDPIEPRPLRAAAAGGMTGIFLGGAVIGAHVLLQRWRRSADLRSRQ